MSERPRPARGTAGAAGGWWIAAGFLTWFVLQQYGHGLGAPFINDDYIFLDKTRSASLATVWAPRDLLFHYYRPWSRELHFAVLQRVFGAREAPFHLVGFGLWLGVMVLWFATVRRLAGPAAAAVATACTAALGSWTVPILWASGVQESWMLLFALLALWAVGRGSMLWAALAFALALLSKESAVVVPVIALLQLRWLGGLSWRESWRRTVPLWGLVATWAALHPLLGGQLWRPIRDSALPDVHPAPWTIAERTLRSLVNLVPWPRPESGWGPAMRVALPGILALGGLAAWGWWLGRRQGAPRAGATPRALTAFGACWALLAWLPLGLPSIAWRSHYTLFGALGAWLAIAPWLARRPALALAVTLMLALLRSATGDTPSGDWSSEWYRRRAAEFIRHLRGDLIRHLPHPPAHSRMFFVRVPSDVGFLAGDAPALRIWYADPTVRGGFYTDYRPRAADEPEGADYFFRFDSTGGWVPVIRGPEDVSQSRRANPRWVIDHANLAQVLAGAGDWRSAAVEYVKLADAESLSVDWAFNAGVCLEASGDSVEAAAWYERAAGRPGADDDVRAHARRLADALRGSR